MDNREACLGPGLGGHAYSPSIGKVQAGGLQVKGWLGLQRETKKREKEERRNKEEVREEQGRTNRRDEGNKQLITN